MKKYIFAFALFTLLTGSIAHADGGFLSVNTMVTEPDNVVLSSQDQRASQYAFGPNDVKWTVTYNGDEGEVSFTGNGSPAQPFGFPKFNGLGVSPYVKYKLQPITTSGIEYSLSVNGCEGEIVQNIYAVKSCTIYATVLSTPLPANVGTGGPIESVATSEAVNVVVDPQTTENTALIAELTNRLVILEQIVALLQQVIALQAQQAIN